MNDVVIISRIWDCFLLEGELFAIKIAIGLLKYFETELRMLTFDKAIKFLKKLPEAIDEEILFNITERISSITWMEYQSVIESHLIAQVNTQTHQALLV